MRRPKPCAAVGPAGVQVARPQKHTIRFSGIPLGVSAEALESALQGSIGLGMGSGVGIRGSGEGSLEGGIHAGGILRIAVIDRLGAAFVSFASAAAAAAALLLDGCALQFPGGGAAPVVWVEAHGKSRKGPQSISEGPPAIEGPPPIRDATAAATAAAPEGVAEESTVEKKRKGKKRTGGAGAGDVVVATAAAPSGVATEGVEDEAHGAERKATAEVAAAQSPEVAAPRVTPSFSLLLCSTTTVAVKIQLSAVSPAALAGCYVLGV